MAAASKGQHPLEFLVVLVLGWKSFGKPTPTHAQCTSVHYSRCIWNFDVLTVLCRCLVRLTLMSVHLFFAILSCLEAVAFVARIRIWAKDRQHHFEHLIQSGVGTSFATLASLDPFLVFCFKHLLLLPATSSFKGLACHKPYAWLMMKSLGGTATAPVKHSLKL